jgi:PPOX class probable F420-dependent enzyme
MIMELSKALEAARATNHSVFTTIRSNGLPQLSNVTHHTDADGIIRISTTANRAKYINLTRRPWAALKVDGPSFWSYAVLEGDVELSKIAAVADDQTVEELITLYRSLAGEHPDWDEYRAAMVADRRVVIRLNPNRAYGLLR